MDLISLQYNGDYFNLNASFNEVFNRPKNVVACLPPYTEEFSECDLTNIFRSTVSYRHFGTILDRFGGYIPINIQHSIGCREILTDYLLANIVYSQKIGLMLRSIIRTPINTDLNNNDVVNFVREFFHRGPVRVGEGHCYFSYEASDDYSTGILPSIICLMLKRLNSKSKIKNVVEFLADIRDSLNNNPDYSKSTGITANNFLIAVIFHLKMTRLLSGISHEGYNGPHTFFSKYSKNIKDNNEWMTRYPSPDTLYSIVGNDGSVYEVAKTIFRGL